MTAPYEAVMLAALQLITKIIDGQPPDVREKLWRMHIEDVEKWRNFIEKIGHMFGVDPKKQ